MRNLFPEFAVLYSGLYCTAPSALRCETPAPRVSRCSHEILSVTPWRLPREPPKGAPGLKPGVERSGTPGVLCKNNKAPDEGRRRFPPL